MHPPTWNVIKTQITYKENMESKEKAGGISEQIIFHMSLCSENVICLNIWLPNYN